MGTTITDLHIEIKTKIRRIEYLENKKRNLYVLMSYKCMSVTSA